MPTCCFCYLTLEMKLILKSFDFFLFILAKLKHAFKYLLMLGRYINY